MVIFVDLEDESEPPEKIIAPHWSQGQNGRREFAALPKLGGLSLDVVQQKDRINPNKNAVTEALGCYPWVFHFHR